MMKTRWLLTWLLTAAITVGGWLAFEIYWREQGYRPTVMDSMDLWSLNRARAATGDGLDEGTDEPKPERNW